jgi:hypothetical protein
MSSPKAYRANLLSAWTAKTRAAAASSARYPVSPCPCQDTKRSVLAGDLQQAAWHATHRNWFLAAGRKFGVLPAADEVIEGRAVRPTLTASAIEIPRIGVRASKPRAGGGG